MVHLATVLTLALLLASARDAAGQACPPAQGPPLAQEPAPHIGTFVIIDTVLGTVQTTLDSANARIARQADSTGIEAHLSFTPTTIAPRMSTTCYPDRPNENIVLMPFIIMYDVSGIRWHGLPYFDRQIGQSIDILISCNGWSSGQGQVRITSQVQPAHLEGPSFSEEALNFFIAHSLTNLLDVELRGRLPGGSTSFTDSLGGCNELGLVAATPPRYRDGDILFRTARIPRLPFGRSSWTFTKIRRLQARTHLGAVLYDDVENLQLTLYVNQTIRTVQVDGMREGDERVLTLDPVRLGLLHGAAALVLIANVQQTTRPVRDTRFLVFSETSLPSGTQTLVVRKTYWEPPLRLPDGRLTKPIERQIDAYEITVSVTATEPVFR